MPDPDKAFGEHMEEEATDKLEGRQLDASVRSGLLIVPGPEGHRLSIEGQESLVGDGHPVGVMAQVAEHVPGATEGRLGIDDPFGSSGFPHEPFEDRHVSPMPDFAGEGELPLLEGLAQAIEELSSDHLCQSPDRDQEVILGWYPSVTGQAQASGSNDDMQVDVEPEFLGPGVKDGGEARLGTQAFPTCGQFVQASGGSLEQEAIEAFSVS